MDRLIYTAMSGANAAAQRQAMLANNMANVSTNGFRAELATFRAVPVQGDGATTRVFSADATAGYLDQPGPVISTGRNLDAMAKDNAWFAVQGLDGTEAYTRNGSLEVNPDGSLVNSNGLTILSDGGAPIAVPAGAEISLGSDGIISAKQAGQPTTAIGKLKLVRPTAEDPLERGNDGLFRTKNREPLASDATARIEPGALEGSNVNPIATMVGMIEVARQYDTQMQLLQTTQANDKAAAQLLGVS